MFLDRPILAIFAHPDDESFIVGGALTFAARKTQVKIIVATRGEKGKRYIDYEIGDENLAAMRRRELEDAAKALGIKDFIVWDYKDGQLDQADEKEIVARLVNEIRAFSPESVLTFGPDGMTARTLSGRYDSSSRPYRYREIRNESCCAARKCGIVLGCEAEACD